LGKGLEDRSRERWRRLPGPWRSQGCGVGPGVVRAWHRECRRTAAARAQSAPVPGSREAGNLAAGARACQLARRAGGCAPSPGTPPPTAAFSHGTRPATPRSAPPPVIPSPPDTAAPEPLRSVAPTPRPGVSRRTPSGRPPGHPGHVGQTPGSTWLERDDRGWIECSMGARRRTAERRRRAWLRAFCPRVPHSPSCCWRVPRESREEKNEIRPRYGRHARASA